jgi:hypothetical protein
MLDLFFAAICFLGCAGGVWMSRMVWRWTVVPERLADHGDTWAGMPAAAVGFAALGIGLVVIALDPPETSAISKGLLGLAVAGLLISGVIGYTAAAYRWPTWAVPPALRRRPGRRKG